MRRRWLPGLVLAVLLLRSSATSADPTNWGQLAQIILWLQQIDRTLRDLRRQKRIALCRPLTVRFTNTR